VKFKGRVVFKQYISKKTQIFGIKVSNYATLLGIHITLIFTSVKTEKGGTVPDRHSRQ